LCYTDRFEDPNLPGEIRVTVTLKKNAKDSAAATSERLTRCPDTARV
jgi:hypothetical protein